MAGLVTPQISYTDFNGIDQNGTVIVQKATKEELKSPLEKAGFINTSEGVKGTTQLVLKLAKGQGGIINCTRDKTGKLNEECAFETYYVAGNSNRLMVPKQPTKEEISKMTFSSKKEVKGTKYYLDNFLEKHMDIDNPELIQILYEGGKEAKGNGLSEKDFYRYLDKIYIKVTKFYRKKVEKYAPKFVGKLKGEELDFGKLTVYYKEKLETKIAEQKTKIAEQKTKIAEQKTKIAEQKTKIAEQKTKIAEQKTKIAEGFLELSKSL